MPANVVEFILRARDEASRVIRRVGNELGEVGKGSVLGRVGAAATALGLVGGAAAAAGGALLLMARRQSDAVERLDRVAASAGATSREVQVLEQVFTDAGLAGEDASQALTFLNRAIGRGEPLLKQLGITTRNAHEALLQLGDVFAGSEDAAKKQAIALKLTGKSSSELVGIMGTLRQTVGETAGRMAQAGAIIDEKMSARARALDQQLDQLALTWKGVWNEMLAAFVPVATEVARQIINVIDRLRDLAKSTPVRIVLQWLSVGADEKTRTEKFYADQTKRVADLKRELDQLSGSRIAPAEEQVARLERTVDLTRQLAQARRAMIEGAPAAPEFGGFGGSGRSRGGGGGSFGPEGEAGTDPAAAKLEAHAKLVAKIREQLGGSAAAAEQLARAYERAGLALKGGKDSLAKVDPTGDPGKLEAHAKLVAAIRSELHLSAVEAEGLARQYERATGPVKQVAELVKTLQLGPEVPDALKRMADDAEDLRVELERLDGGRFGEQLAQTLDPQRFAEVGSAARVLVEQLERAREVDSAAGLVEQLRPALAARARATADLAEALGEAQEGARALYLELLGIDQAPPRSARIQQVRELAEALEAARKVEDRDQALEGARPLLTRGNLSPGSRAELGGLLAEKDLRQFREGLDDVMNRYNLFAAGIQTISDSVRGTFSGLFRDLISGTQGWGDALLKIIRGVVDGALSILEQLVASGLLKALARVAGFVLTRLLPKAVGVPTPGIGGGGGGPGVNVRIPAGAVPGPRVEGGGGGVSGLGRQVVFNVRNEVHAIDARDALLQMQSPGGVLRQAQERMALALEV